MKKMNALPNKKEKYFSKVNNQWLNSNNQLFSIVAGRDYTNKELLLTVLIIITLLFCNNCYEAYPIMSFFTMIVAGVLIKLLNRIYRKKH